MIDKKLISLKEASNMLSMSYKHLHNLTVHNEFLGVFKVGGRYKVDFATFKLNFNDKNTNIKVSFEKLKRYFETESSYWRTVTESTQDSTRKSIKEASLYFFDKEFSKENIEMWKNDLRMQGKADGTIRKYLCGLSKMCEECIKVGLLAINPCKDTFSGLKKAQRKSFLSPEERERLLTVCYEDLADKINFAIETGLRQGEQFNLTWDRVFLKEKEILITETKTHEDRVVPLSPPALKILEKRRPLTKPFDVYKAKDYKDALKRAGITKGITWHDLRRTFGMWGLKGWHTWLNGKRMNLSEVGKFLGHKDLKTTSVYASLDVADLLHLFD